MRHSGGSCRLRAPADVTSCEGVQIATELALTETGPRATRM